MIGVAASVVAAAVASSGSGGGPQGLPPPGGTAPFVRQLAGIPQHGEVLGSPSAPVTLRYYGDLECPFCRAFAVDTLPALIGGDVRSGRLKVQYVSLQTATSDHPTFLTQQAAAYAAGRQGKAWDYIELFYLQQGEEGSGYVTAGFLQAIARQVPGLSFARWQRDRFDPSLAAQVQREQQGFSLLRLPQTTPTLLVTGPRGTRGVQAAASPSQVAALIAAVS